MRHERVYLALVALRCAVCFTPGYIHPDEFFQSPEVAASVVLGVHSFVPLEFTPETSCRSPAVVALVTGWPFALLKALCGTPSPIATFVVPRLVMLLTSFALDASIVALSRKFPGELRMWPALLTLSSSWPVLVLSLRPFSNSLEAVFVATTMALVLCGHRIGWLRSAAVGAVVSIAIFTRVTFAFFALPLGVLFLRRCWKERSIATSVLCATASFAVASSAFVAFDTRFFGSESFVVAPLRFLSYNADVSNLATHGVHPRWLHCIVNMPLLFGPLLVFAVPASLSLSPLRSAAASVVVSALAFLSFPPHQEARFLLALVVPVVALASLFMWDARSRRGTVRLLALWIAFNASLACFFGLFHQAGVVPSLLHIGNSIRDSAEVQGNEAGRACVVFYHTYMPPRHLLAVPKSVPLEFLDLPGSRTLADLSAAAFRCCGNSTTMYSAIDSWISVPGSDTGAKDTLTSHGYELVASFWPHFGSEDNVASLWDASLHLYHRHCNKTPRELIE